MLISKKRCKIQQNYAKCTRERRSLSNSDPFTLVTFSDPWSLSSILKTKFETCSTLREGSSNDRPLLHLLPVRHGLVPRARARRRRPEGRRLRYDNREAIELDI